MPVDTAENDATQAVHYVTVPESTDAISERLPAAGRHRAPTSHQSAPGTQRKAATGAAVRWLARASRPVRAQWFRIWPPLLGMVAGFLIDLGMAAVIWNSLTV